MTKSEKQPSNTPGADIGYVVLMCDLPRWLLPFFQVQYLLVNSTAVLDHLT